MGREFLFNFRFKSKYIWQINVNLLFTYLASDMVSIKTAKIATNKISLAMVRFVWWNEDNIKRVVGHIYIQFLSYMLLFQMNNYMCFLYFMTIYGHARMSLFNVKMYFIWDMYEKVVDLKTWHLKQLNLRKPWHIFF